jgi:hypothetical protein
MQLKKKASLLLKSIVCFLILVSCKKYPEDGHYTFKTVNKRLTGTYILEKYIVNGIDSVSLLPYCNSVNSVPYAGSDKAYYYQFDGHSHIKGCDGSGSIHSVEKKKRQFLLDIHSHRLTYHR